MHHSINAPARPASIPPRFAPVPDPLAPQTVTHYEAGVRTTEHVTASAAMDADGHRGVRYFLQIEVEDATATEVRDALASALEWWSAEEAHLEGVEVAR